MRNRFAMFAGALLVSILSLGYAGADDMKKDPPKPSDKPLDFALKDTDGKDVKLADLKDKVVVLEWTEDGCPAIEGCLKQGTMAKLVKDYGSKVVFIGVCTGTKSSLEVMKKFKETNKIAYPIAMDPTGEVGKMFGAKTTPHMFIVKNGKKLYDGAIDDAKTEQKGVNYVAKALDEILAGKPVTTASTTPYG
ncbi:MAG: redoxin domain-containing protein [Planctomycetota bacterium]